MHRCNRQTAEAATRLPKASSEKHAKLLSDRCQTELGMAIGKQIFSPEQQFYLSRTVRTGDLNTHLPGALVFYVITPKAACHIACSRQALPCRLDKGANASGRYECRTRGARAAGGCCSAAAVAVDAARRLRAHGGTCSDTQHDRKVHDRQDEGGVHWDRKAAACAKVAMAWLPACLQCGAACGSHTQEGFTTICMHGSMCGCVRPESSTLIPAGGLRSREGLLQGGVL